MIFFNIANLGQIAVLFLVLMTSGFSLYFPLVHYCGQRASLKLVIPVSLSAEIIIGYIFYCFAAMQFFVPFYLVLLLVINGYSLAQIKKRQLRGDRTSKRYLLKILGGLALMVPLLYTRFYDAVHNIAPGNMDSYAHVNFVKELTSKGFLDRTYYAPGLHILTYPVTYFLDYSQFYRFIGPVIGFLVLLSIYLVFCDKFKSFVYTLLFFLLFCIPTFNSLIELTISYWPTTLSLIFFLAFLYLFSRPKELNDRYNFIFFSMICLGLSFSVPYLYVQLIPAAIILFLFAKKFFNGEPEYARFLGKVVLILFSGIIIAFGHVYLQTKILDRGGKQQSFPTISYNGNIGAGESAEEFYAEDTGSDSSFSKGFLGPIYKNGKEMLRPKLVRSPLQAASTKTYLWTIAALVLFILEIKGRKDKFLVSLWGLTVIFGVMQITGIFENTLYRGRSGFYFLLLSLPGIVLLLERIKLPRYISFGMVGLFYVYSFSNPPVFFRGYCSEAFEKTYEIGQQFSNQNISVIAHESRVDIVSNKINFQNITADSANVVNPGSHTFLILNKNLCYGAPTAAEAAVDINLRIARARYDHEVDFLKKWNDAVKAKAGFANYKLYWQNENIEIYDKDDK